MSSRKTVALQVVKEMLSQRLYSNIEEGEDDGMTILKAVKTNGDDIIVFFTDIEKFNTECGQYFTKKVNSLELKHCIIVYKNTITSSAKKMLENIPVIKKIIDVSTKEENIIFELFVYKELQFNITTHVLQPRFDLLSNSESNKFKKKYGNKFPKILTTDPISKFYRFTPGQVVKITRKNGYVTYRIVKK